MAISDQQWLDHANQNNQEFSNRQILLKGNGAPSNINDPAPFGSFYKDKNNGDRYEQIEIDPNSNGYDWQLFETGGGTPTPSDEAKRVVEERVCESSLVVGNLVYESNTVNAGVDKVINNTDKRLVVGIVIGKTSATVAKVMFMGAYDGISGLDPGVKAYCSPTGNIAYTIPLSGYVQVLGNISDGNHMDFNPAMSQILRA